MKKSQSNLLAALIDAAHAGTISVTSWEEDFLNDMDERGDDYDLTDNQVKVILRMNEQYAMEMMRS